MEGICPVEFADDTAQRPGHRPGYSGVLCESCGDLTENNTMVDFREWHYRGKVYFAAPLPLLVEAIMVAMLDIDTPPVVPTPLAELPENMQRYFDNKKQTGNCC